mgnify:CR=1 FL=1
MKAQFHDIANVNYQDIWDFQTLLHEELRKSKNTTSKARISGKAKAKILNHIVFSEHNHVITLGKSTDVSNLLSTENELTDKGVELHKINRGGDITYHGPGQITGYLIMDLELLYRDVHRYVRNIEECIIRLLTDYGIRGERKSEYTGVWITDSAGSRKICAIGVHLSRWISMHGFGFNVNTDLSYFDDIIPCGIDQADTSVTSLSREIGREVDISEIKKALLSQVCSVFGIEIV